MTDPLLVTEAVTRRYGYRRVFADVTFSLRRGEVLALLGPNGAGKTTLLRVLAGLLRPSGGSVTRNGTVGLVAHNSMAYDALTARENLAFAAKLWGIVDPERVEELLDRLGLVRWQDQRVATFSRGMTQRLAIARALIHQPDILLLDEPFHSLDDPGVADVVRLLGELVSEGRGRGRGRAIVLVTHQLERLVQLATSVGYLVHGTLVGPEPMDDRSVETIAARYRGLLNRA